MDWVFKASSSSWDLTEMDGLEFDVLDDVSIMGNNQNLELGFSSTIPGSSKKPRGDANEQHVSSCLVDGCMADLSGGRDYHRRHRVCEAHSKTPVVSVGGKDRRFCQQCSRFHSLGEFDDVKRSCRKRLDGHNRRRRKPRAESMYLNYGSFWTNHQGTKLLRFGGSPLSSVKTHQNQKFHVSVQQNPPKPSREKKFPFLLGTESDKLNQLLPEPNQGALYLLSKHTSQSPQTNSNHPQTTGLYTNNNHFIQMIHFRTQEFLENDLYENM